MSSNSLFLQLCNAFVFGRHCKGKSCHLGLINESGQSGNRQPGTRPRLRKRHVVVICACRSCAPFALCNSVNPLSKMSINKNGDGYVTPNMLMVELSIPEVSGISNILLRGNRVEGFIPLSSKLLIVSTCQMLNKSRIHPGLIALCQLQHFACRGPLRKVAD